VNAVLHAFARSPGPSHCIVLKSADRFLHLRGGGSPGEPGVGSRSSALKIGSSGEYADDDAVASDDSKDSGNRVGNQLGPDISGESPATTLAAPPDPIYSLRPHAANRSPPQARPVSPVRSRDGGVAGGEATVRAVTREGKKRLGSGPIGGGSESPLKQPAAGYRNDSLRSRGSAQPPSSS
jgi:hypothetical protein